MENTGAIFFRQSSVSIDPARASDTMKRQAANLAAHELAHHWFGSVVTPASWDELWLNEGFATWLAPKAVAAWDASLVREDEELRAVRAAMSADSLASSRAMSGDAQSSSAIRELFDPIAYRKGAALLRMLEGWLGEETFRRGVNLYVTRHAHATATPSDLWVALGEASGCDVAAVAAPFVGKPGVPLLTFAWEGNRVRITQSGTAMRTVPVAMKIGFADGRVEVRRELLCGAGTELVLDGAVRWVFGNADATGYYRSMHATPGTFDYAQLTPPERLTLLEDLWDSVWSGASDVLEYLHVVPALLAFEETRPVLLAQLGELQELLAVGARGAQFKAWLGLRTASIGDG